MDIELLTKHPELLDKKTLYELRSLVALYPYFQTARLLLLQNLYLLHDPYFGEELRRSALYITDRGVLFNMIEAAHYSLKKENSSLSKTQATANEDRTTTLIDKFLGSIADSSQQETQESKLKRKPTPIDATIDYVSYLLDIEDEKETSKDEAPPSLKGQELIDNFIESSGGKIELKEEPEFVPEIQEGEDSENEDDYFTETLAQIYIRQGRYSKALEIITLLNLKYPEKSAYFADQIRFLKKLILNDKYKK